MMAVKSEEGLRSRKKRLTRKRIAEASLRLYLRDGYDKTTMASVAAEAGVSARTLYLYFPTKEYTLRYWLEEDFYNRVPEIITAQPVRDSPSDVAQRAILEVVEQRDAQHSITMDRLTESSPALSEHKKAILLQLEVQMATALCQLWPDPAMAAGLRRLSMMVIGAMRIGIERWRNDGARLPISEYVRDEFSHLPGTIDTLVTT